MIDLLEVFEIHQNHNEKDASLAREVLQNRNEKGASLPTCGRSL